MKENVKISGFFDPVNVLKNLHYKGVYIKQVIYNNPATIVFWSDDSKTVCVVNDEDAYSDTYSREAGLSICILKKLCGATRVYDIFHDWINEDSDIVEVKDVRKKNKK